MTLSAPLGALNHTRMPLEFCKLEEDTFMATLQSAFPVVVLYTAMLFVDPGASPVELFDIVAVESQAVVSPVRLVMAVFWVPTA